MMEATPTQVTPTKARKRIKQPKKWKRSLERQKKLNPRAPPRRPTCKHSAGAFQCQNLQEDDIRHFHASFYSSTTKLLQDSFILKFSSSVPVKRRRPKNSANQSKDFTTKTFIPTTEKKMIPVCQKTFLNVLGITGSRLKSVVNNFVKTGQSPKENRGGDRKSFRNQGKRDNIIQFLSSLKCVESHYCRDKSVRQYLPSEMNIKKLLRIFNEGRPNNEKVKAWLFRHVFNTKFNLGFGCPKTDVCSKCLELKEKIKFAKIPEEKVDLMTEKRVHNLRAKAFYDLMREERDDLITFSFDCQKNQVLPKVPDQSAYYSRQLYMHNFTVVQGNSKTKLNKNNIFTYYWTENEFPKDSNTIASAVYHCLTNSDLTSKSTVRLMADGCGGQNKNSTLITMCMRWLSLAPRHVQKVELIFPVVGHSYLPPDRVFGIMEREIKTKDTIVDPNDYVEIFSKTATVVKLGHDCLIYDWRKEAQMHLKVTSGWHFQFSKCKRFYIEKLQSGLSVRGEQFYRTDSCLPKSVLKRGKKIVSLNPDEICLYENVSLSSMKLIDVRKLLEKHFGSEWRGIDFLLFYNNLIPPGLVAGKENVETEADYCTECIEEAPDFQV